MTLPKKKQPFTESEARRPAVHGAYEAERRGVRAAVMTPSMSRFARQELGLTQVAVSKASGVQQYIVKQWESGRLRPPAAALHKLRDYFESEGVDFEDMEDEGPATGATGATGEPARTMAPAQSGGQREPRPGFFIARHLSAELVGDLMAHMEANDDRIAALMAEPFEPGFLAATSEATEEATRAAFYALAENYVVFRCLQGHKLIEADKQEPQTVGDYIGQVMKGSAAVALLKAAPSNAGAQAEREPAEAIEG